LKISSPEADLADANGVDMRTLDKALWQYSLETNRRAVVEDLQSGLL
jgi:hypothetical protein